MVSRYFKKYPQLSLENNLNIWLTTPKKRDHIYAEIPRSTQKYPRVKRHPKIPDRRFQHSYAARIRPANRYFSNTQPDIEKPNPLGTGDEIWKEPLTLEFCCSSMHRKVGGLEDGQKICSWSLSAWKRYAVGQQGGCGPPGFSQYHWVERVHWAEQEGHTKYQVATSHLLGSLCRHHCNGKEKTAGAFWMTYFAAIQITSAGV